MPLSILLKSKLLDLIKVLFIFITETIENPKHLPYIFEAEEAGKVFSEEAEYTTVKEELNLLEAKRKLVIWKSEGL